MTKKMMKLIDKSSSLMECKSCGARHSALMNPNTGFYYRGNWQCRYGCK